MSAAKPTIVERMADLERVVDGIRPGRFMGFGDEGFGFDGMAAPTEAAPEPGEVATSLPSVEEAAPVQSVHADKRET